MYITYHEEFHKVIIVPYLYTLLRSSYAYETWLATSPTLSSYMALLQNVEDISPGQSVTHWARERIAVSMYDTGWL